MQLVIAALRLARNPEDRALWQTWARFQQPEESGHQLVRDLGPIVRSYDGQIRWGYYGAVRGLNHMKDVDAIVTLGDPWPNIGDVMSQLAFCPEGTTLTDRARQLCESELE